LRSQGLPPQSVVVELNGLALSPSEFQGVSLKSDDVLEIVKIVAGG
jgi:sulfur carrier protein